MKATAKFRALLKDDGLIMAPGAHDALSARLAELEGFPAVYLGGLACAASMLCLPDQSLITMTELLQHTQRVAAAVNIPIIADIDDGGGNALSVRRTVRLFEAAGVAAVHLEDHVPGKHYGRGGQLFPKEVAVQKLRAAVDARQDSDFVIIARCDALGVSGSPDEAMDRALAYVEAGADMVFIAGLQLKDMPSVVGALPVPLLNVVRDTPRADLEKAGLKVGIYYAQSMQVAFKAVRDMFRELRETGTISNLDGRTPSREEFNDVVGGTEGTQLAERYGVIAPAVRA